MPAQVLYCRLLHANCIAYGWRPDAVETPIYITGHSTRPLRNLRDARISALLLQAAIAAQLYLGVGVVVRAPLADGDERRSVLTERDLRAHVEQALRADYSVVWVDMEA